MPQERGCGSVEERFGEMGWEKEERIKVIEAGNKKTVFLNGRLYMNW